MSEVPSSPTSNGHINVKKKQKNSTKDYLGAKIRTPKRKRRQKSQEGVQENRKVRFDKDGE